MEQWDVIVIGGGPAGLMACVSAAQQKARVLLLDKGEKLGRKLMISGGGRCNVTNAKPLEELIKNIPGNGRFLYSALNEFNNQDIMAFFTGIGIQLKEEDRGRMFPANDKAKTVVNALIQEVKRLGVSIRTNQPVAHIMFDETSVRRVVLQSGETLECKSVVIAVGGCSVPATGSTGDGYSWAEAAGHTITDLYPTAVPLTASDNYIAEGRLQGLSLRNVVLSLYNPKGKKLCTEEGDMLFTHIGVSGPAVLRTSHYVSTARKKFGDIPLSLTIDLMPDKSLADVNEEATLLLKEEPKKAIKNVLRAYLPERMLKLMLEMAVLDENITYHDLPKDRWASFIKLIKQFPVTVSGTLSMEQATVTGGGVNTKEVDPRTMQSKCKQGLFFAGEVLDVHAHTGGYNITVAFTTGHAAGEAAAKQALGIENSFSPLKLKKS
ncbi:NAD(P)/FAD-dependent oxidoreductase [Aneurinibacillus sp. Ricciae_BoGa-3]|uniref:NAD(P)/FAD-dependent oxidoreductase n=1 Tax=Aneurinibacillus sp. Ricciae_BoGa-3 TaxID=3022697 RepID=UPI00234198CE|nr:NAD(P)/FAD-dependent oxidoreductase [Aneurinibacillus sp. Ricciae_BoGa-3]WCK55784.1 NAD(P)/FAD-dependent oxidoreductase [Aneurinibacillus sp. Ricciae_BoGa-3]